MSKKNWKRSNIEDFTEKSNVYFTKEVENQIIKYKYHDLSRYKKNKIYENKIYPVFTELISILVHRYKFYYTGMDVDTLTQVINVHMYNQLESCNFNPENGSAYSYFSRMAKNKLIQLQDKNQKMTKKYGFDSIDNTENFHENYLYEKEEDFDPIHFLNKFILFIENNMYKIFEKDDEIKIVNSIINIMKDDKIVIENKKLLYYMIKEQGDSRNYKINKVINILKDHYEKLKNEYLQNYEVIMDYKTEQEIEYEKIMEEKKENEGFENDYIE